MDVKPILFNTEMVRAILEGRKTVTRRDPFQMPDEYNQIKGLYRDSKNRLCAIFKCTDPEDPTIWEVHARYQAGDILWVRETFVKLPETPGGHFRPNGMFYYKADRDDRPEKFKKDGWRPSIHMPREAARIFLHVTNVRVERLQVLSLKDAEREGIDPREPMFTKFVEVWNKTVPKHPNKFKRYPYQWADNPWVWVIEFERISKEEAQTS